MPLLRECDICGKVDRGFNPDKRFCDDCVERNMQMKQEAFAEMRKEFEAHVVAQVSILNLLKYLREEKADDFLVTFGTEGGKLLDKALADVDTAMKT